LREMAGNLTKFRKQLLGSITYRWCILPCCMRVDLIAYSFVQKLWQ